jgi:predicted transcriptional regulator
MAEDLPEEDEEIERIVNTGKTIDMEPQGKAVYKDKASELKKKQQISDDIIIDVQQEIDKIIQEEEITNINIQKEAEKSQILEEKKPTLTAHDILTKSEKELKQIAEPDKRESHNLLRDMRIITAILLGKKQNKDLSKVLDTDKSFMSKQISELEDRGLIKKEFSGREVNYEVDQFNVMKFLQTKVVIKWKSDKSKKAQSETDVSTVPRASEGRTSENKKDGT